jgi:hypothetical protein
MKATFLIALLFTIGSNLAKAQTTDTSSRQSYYYYPKQNVYFSPKSNSYFYYDSSATSWKSVNQLPANYDINNQSQKNLIYYNGTDVWKNNAADMKQYGNRSTTSGTPNSTQPKQ